ncbi:MAG: glycosyltransferase [Bacteroidetes bacterium]|nr:glycosyltransferase [Bacteroidota bacterium]
MQNGNYNKTGLVHKIPQWIFFALFAFPALPLNITNILFSVFSSYVLLYWIYIEPVPVWKNRGTSLLLILPFIPYLLELLLHLNSATILFEFQKKLLFFIAPVSIPVFIHLFNIKNARPYFLCFTLSIFAVTAYATAMLIADGILFSPAGYENGAYLLRLLFENYSHLHPTYYSLFAAATLFWIMYDFEHQMVIGKLFFIIAGIIILFLTILLAAKMPLLILLAGTFRIIYLKIKNKKTVFKTYTLLLLFSAGIYFIVPSLKSRVDEVKSYASAANADDNTLSQRTMILDCSKDVFNDHFWKGTGAMASQKTLDDCYKSKNPAAFESYKYNSHNQYLTLGVTYGIFILLLFLFSLFIFIKQCRDNPFGIVIIGSIILIMLTESILERQMGVYFFLLFLLLIANVPQRRR